MESRRIVIFLQPFVSIVAAAYSVLFAAGRSVVVNMVNTQELWNCFVTADTTIAISGKSLLT